MMYVCLQTIFNTCVCRPILNATIGGANNFLGLRGIFVLGLLKVAGKKALKPAFWGRIGRLHRGLRGPLKKSG